MAGRRSFARRPPPGGIVHQSGHDDSGPAIAAVPGESGLAEQVQARMVPDIPAGGGSGHPVAKPNYPIRQAFPGLTWRFAGSAGWRSGYVKVSGIGAPMSSKACRWVLVGSVSISMVTWVPVYRTWLRVKVARCSIRPRKLR